MGLGGRKVKQRIGADPRNLTWADDAAKFGQAYLTKLGWDPSRGLGVSGDGRTSHIKVAQKLNLFGIGAGNAKGMGDETVAWKQSRDYEMLLKRLNEASGEADEEKGEDDVEKNEVEARSKTKKKRRRNDDAEIVEHSDKEKKKRKKEKNREEKVERKSKKKKISEDQEDTSTPNQAEGIQAPPPTAAIQVPTPRPMAHRARFLRSKQLASRSSTAVAEILGISSSSSNSPGPSSLAATPFPESSQSSTPVPETNHDLRTASTSVGDYFKEKLAARALDRSKPSTPRPPTLSNSATATDSKLDDDAETPRAGLGSKVNSNASSGNSDGEALRPGLGAKFGSLTGGFTTSNPASASLDDTVLEIKQIVTKKEKSKKGRKETADSEATRNVETIGSVDAGNCREREERTEKKERKEKKEKRKKKRASQEVAS